MALGHGGVPLSLDRMHLHLRILGEICGPLDDDDNRFGGDGSVEGGGTKVRCRKKKTREKKNEICYKIEIDQIIKSTKKNE